MSSDMLAAIQATKIVQAVFVTATFVTGAIYVWSGYGSISWNGHTWQGIGTLGSISPVEEGATIQARGITLGLSGIDPTWLNDVLSEFQLGAPVSVYLGLFSGSPLTLITSPIPIWAGTMDQPTVDVEAQTATISIACESRLVDLNTSVDRRYTNEDQQLVAAGDLGLSFVAGIQEATIYWGSKSSNPLNK